MLGLTILGSTGSIGESTLDVVARHPERFRVVALTGHRQVERLREQCRRFQPELAVVADADAADRLRDGLAADGVPTRVAHGPDALEEAARREDVSMVMAAIVGAAGLAPALAAVEAGKRVLLANKESLVLSGALFMEAARRSGALILPVDSEHSAIFQCLPVDDKARPQTRDVRRIVLTASGGPFRDTPREALAEISPEQACAHPNWDMGRKISVDSATMMNKGLEVIEAHWLFGLPPERLEVVVHRQSIVHSLVDYHDGSMLAQLGNPDMRTPIAYALAWPERITAGVAPLDLVACGRLDFQAADSERFPCLELAYQALRSGGTATAVLNAANEEAVAAFLDRRIGFLDIPRLIEAALATVETQAADSLEAVLAADRQAREYVRARMGEVV